MPTAVARAVMRSCGRDWGASVYCQERVSEMPWAGIEHLAPEAPAPYQQGQSPVVVF